VRVATARPCNILLADDDAIIRRLSTIVLCGAGYQVDSAEDGDAAWHILQTKSYHLLITDHEMPRLSGIELIKKVRTTHAALPVILVSGSMPEEELKAHPELQITATLPKPCDIMQLLRTVKKVLDATVNVPDGLEGQPQSG